MQFPGLTEADFEAYRVDRATSHAYNRPRLEVKQKMLSLGRALCESALVAGTALEVRASEEHPSLWNRKSVTAQWVFFWRDATARKHLEGLLEAGKTLGATLSDPTPYFRHAFLAVYLDTQWVEMSFRIHGDAWVDARNLRALTADAGRRASLLQALRSLPEDFRVGVTDGVSVPVHNLDDASLQGTVGALVDSTQWWFVVRSVPRADAIVRGPGLADDLRAAFDALLPIYRLVSWSHGNDLVFIEREVAAAKATRDAHVQEETLREAAWRAQHEAEILRRREVAVVEARERAASLEPARPAAVHAAVQTVVRQQAEIAAARPPAAPRDSGSHNAPGAADPRPRRTGTDATRGPVRPGGDARPARPARPTEVVPRPAALLDAATDQPAATPPHASAGDPPSRKPVHPRSTVLVESTDPVSLGVRVRVQTGPFAGRVGTVTALDGRGHIKVAFGILSARVETAEVVTLAEV